MKILVIGGTGFVGRRIVEAAVARGHEATLFNRNRTAPGLFPKLELVVGDRAKDLRRLEGRSWDAVVDACGQVPDDVAASLAALGGRSGLYAYVSSIMVYRLWGRNQDESAPQFDAAGSGTADYRSRRALCDRLVREALPGRSLVVRPGILVGPGDPQETLDYWLLRAKRGGKTLAPGAADRVVQALDARDLAAWLVVMIERRAAGVFNACGRGVAMKNLLSACRAASGGAALFTWVENEFLLERLGARRDVEERPLQFLELLPFWMPGLDDRFSSAEAVKAGLTRRPLAATLRDAFAALKGVSATRRGFLDAEREAALLEQWRRRPRG